MEVIVQKFANITQEQFRETASDRFISWDSTIVENGKISGIGGVDAMMKKDLKSVVGAYERMIKKRGYVEFPKGKYQILIKESMFRSDASIVVDVEVR